MHPCVCVCEAVILPCAFDWCAVAALANALFGKCAYKMAFGEFVSADGLADET